ncbi:MAG: WbqC family protein [Flavobacteriales bacterium]|nr:WbqC family protein [Flavobacteriales bacterium]
MALLMQPLFFAPVIQYVAMASQSDIVFEKHDNFQKQTYRNRCYIYGANGKQLLSVPILHSKSSGRQKTKEVKIDNSFSWQKIFIKSFESSYRSSPFFEFYEDEVMQVFHKPYNYLLDLNMEGYEIVSSCLELENNITYTDSYQESNSNDKDFRFLADAKKEASYDLKSYTQVFDNKHGFINNLSILDLLFHEGTNALNYLESQAITLNRE